MPTPNAATAAVAERRLMQMNRRFMLYSFLFDTYVARDNACCNESNIQDKNRTPRVKWHSARRTEPAQIAQHHATRLTSEY